MAAVTPTTDAPMPISSDAASVQMARSTALVVDNAIMGPPVSETPTPSGYVDHAKHGYLAI